MNTNAILSLMKEQIPISKKVTYKRNEFIKKAGTIDTYIYVLVEGTLRIFITDGEEERMIRFAYSDNIFVSLDSFISGKPSDFYIQAIKKCTLQIIKKDDFYHWLNNNVQHLQFWILLLEDLVLQQIEREKDLLIKSPAIRYQRVLNRSPQLFQEIPDKYIAQYLRMTPETLSRLKKS